MSVSRQLFGTDGIRGIANQHPMTPELAMRLGKAIVYVTKRVRGHARVVIGKDTRLSGYMLETAMAAGICAMGGHVMICGPMPTPGVAHLTVSMRCDAGVVISASHNPYADNGIKIFGFDGYKYPDELESELEALLLGDALDKQRATSAHIGGAFRIEDARGRYVVFCKSTFPNALTLEGISIAVDAAHGAAYHVAPLVFSELGAAVHACGVKPNGRNINTTGALHPKVVAKEVLKKKADLGIALDGDADRVIIVDEKGNTVDGDVVMALCAVDRLERRVLAKKTLVSTVMSNLGLERAVTAAGGKLVRTPVGDRYVVERMRQHGYNVGGEQSGHLIFLDHATTGDGIVAALQLLSIMVQKQRPLSELAAAAMQRVPQVLVSERFNQRKPLSQMPQASKAIAGVEKSLRQKGRVVVRWSGTEPKLRVMVEGDDDKRIKAAASDIIEAARRDLRA